MKDKSMYKAKFGVIIIIAIMTLTVFEVARAHTNNNPPDPPEIKGSTSGKISEEYHYSILISDPDDDYMDIIEIDFGDENITLIRCCGQPWWRSGDNVTVTHSWSNAGTYVIRARVKDIKGAWSDWGSLEVSIPKKYHNPLWLLFEKPLDWLEQLFEREILPEILNL